MQIFQINALSNNSQEKCLQSLEQRTAPRRHHRHIQLSGYLNVANIKKIITFIIIICLNLGGILNILPFAVSDLSLILYFYFIKIDERLSSL